MPDSAPPQLPLAWLAPGFAFVGLLVAVLAAALALRWLLARGAGRERFDRVSRWLEQALLTTLFLGVLFVTCLQIFMRNVFHSGFLWTEPMARYLVLWLAFAGAFTATARARHLAIDIVALLLPARVRARLQRAVAVVAAGVCIALANGAYVYLRQEFEFGREAFLGMRTWVVQSVLLFGFCLLAYRFLVASLFGYGADAESERPVPAESPGSPGGAETERPGEGRA